MQSNYFPVHAHSEYSWLDGMGSVQRMVQTVVKHGQPALALTDHGVMAGCIRLYKECRKAGVTPFPGEEFYLVKSVHDDTRDRRYHVGLLALDAKGYEGLVALSSLSHEQFYRKPIIDLGNLSSFASEYGEHVALTTGCFFGLPIQMLVNEGPAECRAAISMYASWFPHTFVELQNHSVNDESHNDDDVVEILARIAFDLGLPVVAGQDSHYCEHNWKPAHDMMKEIGYHGTDGDDFKFPGDSFHMADAEWVADHYEEDVWDQVEEGHAALFDLNTLRIPELDTYKFHVPAISSVPNDVLKRETEKGLHLKGVDLFDTYQRRAASELEVIKTLDFSNYFLLIKDMADWCRKQGITINARGSANGSLVCWVLGITNVDPVEWQTDFSRFLSTDRKKPPDIDIDIASDSRHAVIEYLRTKFPTMIHIGTYGRLGMTLDDDGNEKGSLYQQYAASMRRRVQNYDGRVDPDHQQVLELLGMMDVRRGPGVHASGLVLPSDDLPVERLLPKMWIASSKTFVTQPVMEDVEDAGYVKGDLLGLRMLETFDTCLELIGKPRGDLDWIPWDDRKACTQLRSGKTVGLFQFEGPSTARGARKMKVKDTMDAVLALALFRPALMNGGQTDRYLAAREAKKGYEVPALLQSILDQTYGVPVFQEQVIDIMRRVGLPYDELNEVLKAVKASNDKIGEYAQQIMSATAPRFKQLAVAAGMTMDEATASWKLVKDFSDYGFNRAHATSYGHMAYRSAYLKAHYPLEFMTATLNTWAGTPKERKYVQEARRLGFSIVKADVNHSNVGWAIDHSRSKPSIRRGLLTISGIGLAAAETIVDDRLKNGPFQSVDEMVVRLPARPVSGGKQFAKTGSLVGVMGKLADAGALRSLGYDVQQGDHP